MDFVWRAHSLIVETDGWAAHGTRRAFERDRARDADLVVAGGGWYGSLHRRLETEPRAVAHQLRSLLGAWIQTRPR